MQLRWALGVICLVFCQTARADSADSVGKTGEAGAICGARAPQIEVMVSGLGAGGLLTVELYRPSEADFLRRKSRIGRIRVPAEKPEQTVCFDIESAGRYALAAYHDVDGDRKLDRKWNRLPDEPFALSNNRKLKLRMPEFEDAAFEAGPGSTRVELRLRR